MGSKYSRKVVLQAKYQKLGVRSRIGLAANELGLGCTGGYRRTLLGVKDKFVKARIRADRVHYLVKKNKKANALYHTGVLPASTYGAEGIGYSPSMIGQLRTMAADCMGSAKVGRCPITAIAIAEGSPM